MLEVSKSHNMTVTSFIIDVVNYSFCALNGTVTKWPLIFYLLDLILHAVKDYIYEQKDIYSLLYFYEEMRVCISDPRAHVK